MTISVSPVIDVSIVVPTHNEGDWLARTVESIRSARTECSYEIIVIDDGCTDGSVTAVSTNDRLRMVATAGHQTGLIAAKNLGAKAARGRYICFVDSHVMVPDYWVDHMLETCKTHADRALVSCKLADVGNLDHHNQQELPDHAYTLRNSELKTAWYFYDVPHYGKSYSTPLTPGGVMFVEKCYFHCLGGFDDALRKWGAEDIQLSLQNYYSGGKNMIDRRVLVYHYFKNRLGRRRNFEVSRAQYTFNRLYVAAAFFPVEYHAAIHESLGIEHAQNAVLAQLTHGCYQERLSAKRHQFRRGFEAWVGQFPRELSEFLEDIESKRELARGYGPSIK
jgi:glycosyltransferase involved in cell wall biosynthesis